MKKISLLVFACIAMVAMWSCGNSNNAQSDESATEEECCEEGECKDGECEFEKGDNPGAKAIAIIKEAIKKMDAATSLEEIENVDHEFSDKMEVIEQEGQEWAENLEKSDPEKFEKFENKFNKLTKKFVEITTKKMGELTGQAIEGLDPEAEE